MRANVYPKRSPPGLTDFCSDVIERDEEMNWFAQVGRRAAEKAKVTQLRYDFEAVWEASNRQRAGLRAASDEFRKILHDTVNQSDLIVAEIDEIETAQVERRADRLQIPVPPRPYGSDSGNEYWSYNKAHQRFYLTTEGKYRLRRLIYEEREMRWKPLLTYCAFGLSVASFLWSVMKP